MQGPPPWVLCLAVLAVGGARGGEDPRPIVYPGQATVALLTDLHESGLNGSQCGALNPRAVQEAMAVVWAVHRANSQRTPAQLSLGVTVYDTCGRKDLAQRQVHRILSQVSTGDCKPSSPVLGVISQSDGKLLKAPSKALEAFRVINFVTTTAGSDLLSLDNTFSTAVSELSLAKTVVAALLHLNLREVATAVTNVSVRGLARHFVREARAQDVRVVSLDSETDPRVNSVEDETGEFPRPTVVFLRGGLVRHFLASVSQGPSSKIPWILVVPDDLPAALRVAQPSLCALGRVLVVSPRPVRAPEFQAFYRRALESVAGHPLLAGLAGLSPAQGPAGVAGAVRAVWALAGAARAVQRRACRRRGSDCVLYLRRELPARVLETVREAGRDQGDPDSVHLTVGRGSQVPDLEGTSLRFLGDGELATARFGLRLLAPDCSLHEVGSYDEEAGLELDPVSVSPGLTPSSSFLSRATMRPPTSPPAARTLPPPPSTPAPPPSPTFKPPSPSSSFMTILPHHYASEEQAVGEGATMVPMHPMFNRKPWVLGVLVAAGLAGLVALYVLVFLLLKVCEGGVLRPHSQLFLHLALLLAVLALSGAACVLTFRPLLHLCGLQKVFPNMALGFLYACLLLKTMTLRAQRLLGLGGRLSKANQFLSLLFIFGVQFALEIQWWLLKLPQLSEQVSGRRECSLWKGEVLASQSYVGLLIVAATASSVSTRGMVSAHREGPSLLWTNVMCLGVFAVWAGLAGVLLEDDTRNMVLSLALLVSAMLVLVGVFTPVLYYIHRRKKPLSYSDSLSTGFTMFKEIEPNLRGRKVAKRLSPAEDVPRNTVYDNLGSAYP